MTPRHLSHPLRSRAVVGLGLATVLAVGACSASGSTSGSSAAGSGAAGAPAKAIAPQGASDAQAGGAPGSPGAAGAAGSAGSAATASPAGPAADLVAADKLVRTAALQVQVDDVEAGAAEVRRIAVTAGGMVVSENSTAVPSGTAKGSVDKDGSRSVLALAVPSDTLDRVLDDVGKLGTTVNRSSSSRDVTSTYVDTQSRITTMRAGLDQLRSLLAKTTALDQVVTLETEISRRQADLDSLQAQLNALDKKVAMSTLTVTLATAAQVVLPQDDGTGFLAGLTRGWHAFVTAFGGVLTVLGVVLPFVVLIALIGLPVYVWLRRRRSPRTSGDGALGGAGSSGSPGPTPHTPPSNPDGAPDAGPEPGRAPDEATERQAETAGAR